jgi:hypothetical protein
VQLPVQRLKLRSKLVLLVIYKITPRRMFDVNVHTFCLGFDDFDFDWHRVTLRK